MSAQTPPPTPTISYVGEDGTLAEILYQQEDRRTLLAVRDAAGSVHAVETHQLANGETIQPYRPANNLIATGCVLLPSAVGQRKTQDQLLADIRAYLHRYVDLSPLFAEIAAHYVLLTWAYDAFNELGYLRFRGDYGTGKTRALIALGSICYKPFFASGASTVSPIFHVLDAFGGTLVLDEADLRFSDATADLVKILNNGNVRGLPVLRTMANRHRELSPTAFRVFGPKLIAMRDSFEDPALESRFITEETGGRPLRSDIPVELPSALAIEALAIRNDLLAWRLATHGTIRPRSERLVEGVEPRFNQTMLSLLSLVDDDDLRRQISDDLLVRSQRVKDERSWSDEGSLTRATLGAFNATDKPHVSVAEITLRLNRELTDRFLQPISNRRTGWLLRNKLRVQTTKSRGVYVVPQAERVRIEALAARYGVVTGDNGEAPPS